MPSLIAKYREKALESQFKRAYSNIYNAIRLLEVKEGAIPLCYYSNSVIANNDGVQADFSQCEEFYDKLTREMNVIKTCKGNAYDDNCVPKYQGVDTIKKYEDTSSITGCSGYRQNNILNRNWAFVLNDGTIIFTYSIPRPEINSYAGVFALDINGKKGPNKWGYDIFSFALAENQPGIFKMQQVCSLVEEGGKTPNEMLSNIDD